MRARPILLFALLALLVGVRWFTRDGGGERARTTHEPEILAAEASEPEGAAVASFPSPGPQSAERAELEDASAFSSSWVRAPFVGSGSLVLTGREEPDRGIELTFRCAEQGTFVSASGTSQGWSAEFPAATHELVRATLDGVELKIVRPAVVSAERPRCAVELSSPALWLLDVVDAVSGERIAGPISVATPVSELEPPQGPVFTRTGRNLSLLDSPAPREAPLGVAPLGDRSSWYVSGLRVPAALPDDSAGRALVVEAKGYREARFVVAPAPGVQRLELVPTRRLIVSLTGAPDPGSLHVVRVLDGDRLVDSKFSVRSSEPVRFDLGMESLVRVTLALQTDLGPPIPLDERELGLSQAGDTECLLRAGAATAAAPVGALQVTVTSNEEVDPDARWSLSLSPHAFDGWESYWARTNACGLDAFQELEPGRSYRRTFERIAPGTYSLLLSPLGCRRDVLVRAGETSEERLVVPALARLRVLPVDSVGASLDPAELGGLAWGFVDELPADVQLARGLAEGWLQQARSLDEGWGIDVEPGREIELHSLGSQLWLPEAKRLVPGTGHADVQFAFLDL